MDRTLGMAGGSMLFPLGDMLNHDDASNAALRWRAVEGRDGDELLLV